jgi:hypothetical protein
MLESFYFSGEKLGKVCILPAFISVSYETKQAHASRELESLGYGFNWKKGE